MLFCIITVRRFADPEFWEKVFNNDDLAMDKRQPGGLAHSCCVEGCSHAQLRLFCY